MQTLRVIYEQGKRRLRQAGIESPGFDALCILEQVLGANRQALILHGDTQTVPPEQERAFLERIERRAKREPLQYIVGQWPFLHFELKMGKGVLIAREDTAVLVETAVKMLHKPQPLVLDLCAGTGAVGFGIASKICGAQVICVEKYPQAMAYLQENISFCNAQGIQGVTAVQGDILQAKFAQNFAPADAVVANPPYIETGELPTLQAEVQNEPQTALDGGADGLKFYRALAQIWAPKLKPGGVLAVEIGQGQQNAVAELFTNAGIEKLQFAKDLGGIVRVVAGVKS
mgnify:CR=1 FL=1